MIKGRPPLIVFLGFAICKLFAFLRFLLYPSNKSLSTGHQSRITLLKTGKFASSKLSRRSSVCRESVRFESSSLSTCSSSTAQLISINFCKSLLIKCSSVTQFNRNERLLKLRLSVRREKFTLQSSKLSFDSRQDYA